jgi:ribulose-phosphate 3-epimerase
MSIVVPAVLPESEKDLEEKLALFASLSSVSRVQVDVVDGKFATPTSWPYSAPEEMRGKIAHGETLPHLDRIEYEIDLMCLDADQAICDWLTLGASRLTLHAESSHDLSKLLPALHKKYGAGDGLVTVGLALNNETNLSLIEPYLSQVQYVQCMGIATIGRQGQVFDTRVLAKARELKKKHPAITLQVDGGISIGNAGALLKLGVSHLIVGSALVNALNPQSVVDTIEDLQTPFAV